MSAIAHQPLDLDECQCENCRFMAAMKPLCDKWRDTAERKEANVLIRAVRLSPDLETCEALLRGEQVPKSRLDPRWRKAYGL